MEPDKPEQELNEMKGAFVQSLIRSNKDIKKDRALMIVESTEMFYKREIENRALKIKNMKRERETLIDALSPGDKMTLKISPDYNPQGFVDKDHAIGVDIRNEEIELGLAQDRYNHLFNS